MSSMQTNAPEWAEFYNPILGGTYFGVIAGMFRYKHNNGLQVYYCATAVYNVWKAQDETVSVIKIQENE